VTSETSAIRTDAGELPEKEQITFRTLRKLKNKITTFLFYMLIHLVQVPFPVRILMVPGSNHGREIGCAFTKLFQTNADVYLNVG